MGWIASNCGIWCVRNSWSCIRYDVYLLLPPGYYVPKRDNRSSRNCIPSIHPIRLCSYHASHHRLDCSAYYRLELVQQSCVGAKKSNLYDAGDIAAKRVTSDGLTEPVSAAVCFGYTAAKKRRSGGEPLATLSGLTGPGREP